MRESNSRCDELLIKLKNNTAVPFSVARGLKEYILEPQ